MKLKRSPSTLLTVVVATTVAVSVFLMTVRRSPLHLTSSPDDTSRGTSRSRERGFTAYMHAWLGEQREPTHVGVKERLPVARDVRAHEPWPEVQRGSGNPGIVVFDTVHWMWCSVKTLEFRHYLSVLSAVRILQPRKLVMHFTDMPNTDVYNTWFNELKDSLPNLELEKFVINVSCESPDTLKVAVGFLSQNGGVFIGENVILTRFPQEAADLPFWFAFAPGSPRFASNGIVIASRPLDAGARDACLQSLTDSQKTGCITTDTYNNRTQLDSPGGAECIYMDKTVFPRDIMQADSPFGELARWLFYGRRSLVTIQAEGAPIPRIAHFIRIRTNGSQYDDQLTFSHFISMLSAKHVAGFHRVVLHADEEPRGRWWEELRKENITVVKLLKPTSIYQHPLELTVHVSDIARYLLLYKYGGAYQDWDVFWTQYVPDSLLANPAVIGYDWNFRGYPNNINNGVILARARAHWLHHFLLSHRDFHNKEWCHNSALISYRIWELYPQTASLDPHLQVICNNRPCHPTWLPGYVYGGKNKQPLSLINDTYAVHVTMPKPPKSLTSLEALQKGTDVFAAIGRQTLEKSNRRHWLEANFTESNV